MLRAINTLLGLLALQLLQKSLIEDCRSTFGEGPDEDSTTLLLMRLSDHLSSCRSCCQHIFFSTTLLKYSRLELSPDCMGVNLES